MKVDKMEKQITKIYLYSNPSSHYISETDAMYSLMSNNCYPINLKRITNFNFIALISYENIEDLHSLLKTTSTYHNVPISIKRVFKSMKLYKDCPVPKESFLKQIILGISGLIKKPVEVKVTDTRASKWAIRLTQKWQKEYLDKPEVFEKIGIKNVVDITKDGKLRFMIIKTGNYIITYFVGLIDEYVGEENET